MDVVEKARLIAKKACPTCNEEFAAEDESTVCPRDHSELRRASTEKDPLVGTVIGEHYEILEMIGSGGWALIYKAKQRPLNRLVAIKILHGHLAGDPEKVKRFKREAEAATKLVHENVGSVFDYGLLPEGQPYMVMEYLEGTTLQDMLKRDGKMPVEKALSVFREICSGLALAHSRNIVHRDIKPSNIYMVEEERRVKILDFGLAKILASAEDNSVSISLTQTGQTIGTPSYMSPEQCTGFPLDSRSDLYSVGCLMFEMLTGKRAFEGRNLFETMSLQINTEVSFDASTNIPADLQLVVLKALTKDPQQRYQTAEDLDAALETVQDRLQGHGSSIWVANMRAFWHKQRRVIRRWSREPMVSAVVVFALALITFSSWPFVVDRIYPKPQSIITSEVVYKEHMADGQRRFDKNKFESAADLFKQAAQESLVFGEADPRHMDALIKQSDALKRAGKADQSLAVEKEINNIKQRYTGAMYGDETQNALKIADLEKRLRKVPSDKNIAQQLCLLRNNQAQLMLTNSRIEDAQTQLNAALKLEETLLGTNTAEYATTLSNLAYVYACDNQPGLAEENYKAALALREKLFGEIDPYVAKSLRHLGDFYFKQQKYEQARQLLQRSLSIYEKCGSEADIAWDLNNLGLVYLKEADFPQAEVALEKALILRQRISKDNPDYIDIGRSLHHIGMLRHAQGRLRDAVKNFEDALKIYETQLTPTHVDTLKCANELASLYILQQDYKRAEPLLKRVTEALDPSDPMAEQAKQALDRVQRKLGSR